MSSSVMYGLSGHEVKDPDRALAKSVVTDSGINRFYVKRYRSGFEAGRFLNPDSPWYTNGSENKIVRTRGEQLCVYSQVGEDTFRLYLRFLKTKNPSYLRQAERDMV